MVLNSLVFDNLNSFLFSFHHSEQVLLADEY